MITHERLKSSPGIARALAGVTLDEFERLFADFEAAAARLKAAQTHSKRGHRKLRRKGGAGHPHDLDARTRLLLVLVWLRVYPTYELLGWLFGLDKSNAWHNVQDGLAVIATLADFPFERPAKERAALGSPEAIIAAFPEVRVIVDAKEQPFRRPEGWEEQKPFYSGKRKQHTVKTQIACTPSGRVAAVSATVPGSVHDLTLLRLSGLLGKLGDGDGLMADKGYVGVAADLGTQPLALPTKATRGHELTEAQKEGNRKLSRFRVLIEHVNAQLNRFQVLRQTFRSIFGRHGLVIRVVALLVDRRVADVPLKTYPAPT